MDIAISITKMLSDSSHSAIWNISHLIIRYNVQITDAPNVVSRDHDGVDHFVSTHPQQNIELGGQHDFVLFMEQHMRT